MWPQVFPSGMLGKLGSMGPPALPGGWESILHGSFLPAWSCATFPTPQLYLLTSDQGRIPQGQSQTLTYHSLAAPGKSACGPPTCPPQAKGAPGPGGFSSSSAALGGPGAHAAVGTLTWSWNGCGQFFSLGEVAVVTPHTPSSPAWWGGGHAHMRAVVCLGGCGGLSPIAVRCEGAALGPCTEAPGAGGQDVSRPVSRLVPCFLVPQRTPGKKPTTGQCWGPRGGVMSTQGTASRASARPWEAQPVAPRFVVVIGRLLHCPHLPPSLGSCPGFLWPPGAPSQGSRGNQSLLSSPHTAAQAAL